MIQFPRSFFRQLRTVLRKAFPRANSLMVFQSGPAGVSIRCQQDGIAISYQTSGRHPADRFTVPMQMLKDIDGKGDAPISLETNGKSKVVVRWQNAAIPCVEEYESADVAKLPEFPSPPNRFSQQAATFLPALDDAMKSASQEAIRFAVNKIQIRGKSGIIAATDGHQLLWQNSFQFPFSEDVLVPRVKVFDCFAAETSIGIANTKTHVCVQAGPWIVFLPIDRESRFPNVESIIPNAGANATRFQFTSESAAYLAKALPRLPGSADENPTVTLDLGKEVIVRAKAEDQECSTDVVLTGTSVSGMSLRYAIDRQHLLRAMELGFTEGVILDADKPMLFTDERRKFVIRALGKERVVAPTNNDVRVLSNSNETANHQPPITRRNEPMKSSRAQPIPTESFAESNGHENGNGPTITNVQQQKHGFNALFEEAQSIQNGLRDLLLRTNQLLNGLKAYRRHAKTMQSTLASLRQLQQVEA